MNVLKQTAVRQTDINPEA